MKKIKSIYITILGSALALTTHDHSANAAGMSFEQCMEQYGAAIAASTDLVVRAVVAVDMRAVAAAWAAQL